MMDDKVSITVYGNPQQQERGRIVRRGKFYGIADGSKSRDWKTMVKVIAQDQKQVPLWDCPIHANLEFYFQKPKSAKKDAVYADKGKDIDNLIKCVFDALQGVVYVNDSRIVSIKAVKKYGEPMTIITLNRIG